MIYLYLFAVFFRIGAFSFGGGMAMLPLIFQSVSGFGIMTAHEFSDFVALSQVTPGPVAVNAATYAGFTYAGLPGAFAATMGVCIPSFVIMLAVMRFIDRFNDSRCVKGIFEGLRPAVIGLIASAALFVGGTVLVDCTSFTEFAEKGLEIINIAPAAVFAAGVIMAGIFKMRPVKVIVIMGITGALICG